MKMTFRWYGEKDCIPLPYIKQIQGMSGVVTAVYDVPVGEVWPLENLQRMKALCDENGLEMEVIESVPVHEDIKLGRPTRDRYIEAYRQNILNCGKVGVKCICYNFMPVFDWLRTDLYFKHKDGATSLAYCHDTLMKLDPKNLHLPGWDESYSTDELNALLEAYEGMTLTEEEVNDFCLDMPRYKRPRKIIFADVPRNPTGKIEKPKLRSIYCGESVVAQQNEIK